MKSTRTDIDTTYMFFTGYKRVHRERVKRKQKKQQNTFQLNIDMIYDDSEDTSKVTKEKTILCREI